MRLIRFFLSAFKSNYGNQSIFFRCRNIGGDESGSCRNIIALVALHLFEQANKSVKIIIQMCE